MLPVRDDNPQVDTPIATYVLIGLNVLAWFFLQGLGDEQTLRSSVHQFGLKPGELFSNEHYTGQWSELVSSMFMHGSWMHIIGNMWFLWIFGDNIEDSMGSLRFVIFYLLSGLAAAAAQIAADTSSVIPMVGASGAIGGVMGAYIVLYPKVKVHMLVFIMIIRVPAIAMLGYWMGVQLVGGVSSIGASGGGTAFWAHVGGFAAGAILGWFFKDEEMLINHPYYGWKQRANPADIWQDPRNRQ
jgi:membrane associated rhomboid family serine protease